MMPPGIMIFLGGDMPLQSGHPMLLKVVLRVGGATAGPARPSGRQGGAGNGSSFRNRKGETVRPSFSPTLQRLSHSTITAAIILSAALSASASGGAERRLMLATA